MDPDHIHDIFSAFKPVSVRRMFGGAGIYADGPMFALVADGVIYLKVDLQNEANFEREQLPSFTYAVRNNKRAVMSYRRMPDRLYDDPHELACWAREALAAAQRTQRKSQSAGAGGGRRRRAKPRR